MTHRTSSVALIAAGAILLSIDATGAGSETAEARREVSRTVQQFERMRSPGSNERLFYRVREVARLADVSENEIRESIRDGRLAAITVDGERLIPAGFARSYVERAASRRWERATQARSAERQAAGAADVGCVRK